MSLWTPDGERPVRRDPAPSADAPPTAGPAAPSPDDLLAMVAAANGTTVAAMPADRRREMESHLGAMSDEERTALALELGQMAEMLRVRAELAELPASTHLSRFLQQFVESFLDLTAAYLQSDPPKFADAATMIASVETLLDAFDAQLADQRGPVDQAVAQLKMAFVELQQQAAGDGDGPDAAPGTD